MAPEALGWRRSVVRKNGGIVFLSEGLESDLAGRVIDVSRNPA
jgi:hypothetical protein